MKTLAQLIAELQEIPNPEQVVVIGYSGDAQFYFPHPESKEKEALTLDFLDEWQIMQMKEAGFTRAISL